MYEIRIMHDSVMMTLTFRNRRGTTNYVIECCSAIPQHIKIYSIRQTHVAGATFVQ